MKENPHSWRLARQKEWGTVTGWGLDSSLPIPSLQEEQNLNLSFEGKELYSVKNPQPGPQPSKMGQDDFDNFQAIGNLIKILEKDALNFNQNKSNFFSNRVLNEKQFINALKRFQEKYKKDFLPVSSEPTGNPFSFFNPALEFERSIPQDLRRVSKALSLWRKKPYAYTYSNPNFNIPGGYARLPFTNKCNSFVYDAVRGEGEEGPHLNEVGLSGIKVCSALAMRQGNCPDYSKGLYSPSYPRSGEILSFFDPQNRSNHLGISLGDGLMIHATHTIPQIGGQGKMDPFKKEYGGLIISPIQQFNPISGPFVVTKKTR